MGCDIHMMVEKKDDDGTWRWVAPPKGLDTWADEHGYTDWYPGRCYDAFAILADVRNGSGFGGCDTGDGFKPIAPPRGVPEDASPEYKANVERWGVDGHSHSWHTLADLQACDWAQTTLKRGWVTAAEYTAWREQGHPDGWSGGVGGYSVQHITNDEMARKIEKGDPTEHCYTQVMWRWTYARCASYLVEKVMPALAELGKPEDVRIVFFFDN